MLMLKKNVDAEDVDDTHADADNDEVADKDVVIPVRRETHEGKCPQCICKQKAFYLQESSWIFGR